MKQSIFTIKENVALTDTVYRMVLVGDTSHVTNCGQFVNIKLDGLFLRRPISVCDCVGNELTLIYKVVGTGTEQMSRLTAGDTLDILTGLGNGYDTSLSGDTPILLGGLIFATPWPRKLWEKIRHTFVADILMLGLFWIVIYYISTAAQDPFMYFQY